jgi:hypothetical protein
MEARRLRAIGLALFCLASLGASSQTRNFIVHTADPQHAAAFAQQAERLRRELAIAWLGQALPDWSYPCPITATVGPHLGAGGATSFVFDRGEVYGWRMTIQGSYERILDSVLPHEITHMIFASYFRRPLPRWADEGGATTVEHESEKSKHRQMLVQFLRSSRGIPFDRMFAMTEYPADIMPLYAQAYALAEYLIQQGGRRKYVDFVADGLNTGRWTEALQKHYGFRDLQTLQNQWVAWVAQGFPPLRPGPERMLAAGGTPAGQLSVAPSAGNGTSNPQPVGTGSGISVVNTSLGPNQAVGDDGLVSLASNRPPYRPGSTARPGIIWTLPLVPLPETPATGATLAQVDGRGTPVVPGNKPISQTADTSRQEPPSGQENLLSGSVGGAGGSGQAVAQINTPSPSAWPKDSPAPEGSGKTVPHGPDGWLAAGSRPVFAPGSIGKVLTSPPAFQPLASSGAVDNQLSRPQMPQSAPGIRMTWPNAALR